MTEEKGLDTMVTTAATEPTHLLLSVRVRRGKYEWLAWHHSKPFWHSHGAKFEDEPD